MSCENEIILGTVWVNEKDRYNFFIPTKIGRSNLIYEMVSAGELRSSGEVCSTIEEFKKSKTRIDKVIFKKEEF